MQLLRQLGAETGGDYGYGLEDLLSLLATDVSGLNLKDANSYATLEGKLSNNFQDLAKSATDPLMRILLGTYLPAQAEEEPLPTMPIAERYIFTLSKNPEDPTGLAAKGLVEGNLTPIEAYGMIAASPAGANLDPSAIWSTVNAITGEIEKRDNFKQTSAANDVFAKAGLPSPYERYTDDLDGDGNADSVPVGEGTQAYFNKRSQTYGNQAKQYGDLSESWKKQNPSTPPPGPNFDNPLGIINPPPAEPQATVGDWLPEWANKSRGPMRLPGGTVLPEGWEPEGKKKNPTKVWGSPGAKPTENAWKDDPENPFAERQKESERMASISASFERSFRNERARRLEAEGRTPLKDNLTQTLIKLLLSR